MVDTGDVPPNPDGSMPTLADVHVMQLACGHTQLVRRPVDDKDGREGWLLCATCHRTTLARVKLDCRPGWEPIAVSLGKAGIPVDYSVG